MGGEEEHPGREAQSTVGKHMELWATDCHLKSNVLLNLL
jgi:hypothetical protein